MLSAIHSSSAVSKSMRMWYLISECMISAYHIFISGWTSNPSRKECDLPLITQTVDHRSDSKAPYCAPKLQPSVTKPPSHIPARYFPHLLTQPAWTFSFPLDFFLLFLLFLFCKILSSSAPTYHMLCSSVYYYQTKIQTPSISTYSLLRQHRQTTGSQILARPLAPTQLIVLQKKAEILCNRFTAVRVSYAYG